MTSKTSFIDLNKKRIYYTEIIHPKIFEKLYLSERPIAKFSAKVILSDRPFAIWSAKQRAENFKEKDILLVRIAKDNKEFQFISKLYEWGKIHVSNKVVEALDIKNHEILDFQIIAKNQDVNIKEKELNFDLANISKENTKMQLLPRSKDIITLYSKQKIPITLPRFIKISPELFELTYLIFGDGHYQYKLYFVSKSPELHEFVLELFEKILHIPKNLWRARILMHDTAFADYAKNYWKNKLNLDEKQFYNTSRAVLNTDKKGNLRIIIDKTIVSLIFKFILNECKLNGENKIHALNGLLCAEGGAQVDEKGLHKITLSFNKKEKDMFKDILDDLHFRYKIEQNKNFIISGWDDLYLFFKIFFSQNVIPFRVHNQRRNNAINGFLNHSFTKTMVKYLSALKYNNDIDLNKFSKLLKIRKDSILDTIRKKQYVEFINIEGKGINRYHFKLSISKEGINFLNLINVMEVQSVKLPFENIKREILVKRRAETSEKFGCLPDKRSVTELINYGVVNIDKPKGPTSHQVSAYVQNILGISKSGHSGTLE